MIKIPFNRPYHTGREREHILAALEGRRTQGDGPYTRRAESMLQELTGAARVLLTASGTDALEMAVLLSGVGPGDEVLMPSYTFVSTATAVVLRGATPVFFDISPETLNCDAARLEECLTPRTKAIMPVHYAGFSCDMDRLMEFAERHKLLVIEDAAHAIGAKRGGRPLGSWGQMAAFSFHETKNISCGEGGALAINDPALVERAEIIRDKGTNRRKFLRGEVDKYTWVDLGSSFLSGELPAAMLVGQLEHVHDINERRARIFSDYMKGLGGLETNGRIVLPKPGINEQGNGHIFHVLVESNHVREAMRLALMGQGIQTTSHYEPLHASPAGRRFGRVAGPVNQTDSCAGRMLRLPIYPDLTKSEQEQVISAIWDFFAR
ncbi:dTDP-4-amino-4,6-dideoxygalactose transaminase [bacterium]|nr:dTDP-4-amino-4,6-dideoxygalactose transaminase [bacterium]